MAANTSSRGHPLQHEVLVSPISDEMNYSPVPSTETKSKAWATTITHVASWPEEARSLKKHTWLTFVYGLGDLILVILPLYFIREYNDTATIIVLIIHSSCYRCSNPEWETDEG
jgi:hypothetical protein